MASKLLPEKLRTCAPSWAPQSLAPSLERKGPKDVWLWKQQGLHPADPRNCGDLRYFLGGACTGAHSFWDLAQSILRGAWTICEGDTFDNLKSSTRKRGRDQLGLSWGTEALVSAIVALALCLKLWAGPAFCTLQQSH